MSPRHLPVSTPQLRLPACTSAPSFKCFWLYFYWFIVCTIWQCKGRGSWLLEGPQHQADVRGQLQELVFSFFHMGPGNGTWFIRLCDQHLHLLLSHLTLCTRLFTWVLRSESKASHLQCKCSLTESSLQTLHSGLFLRPEILTQESCFLQTLQRLSLFPCTLCLQSWLTRYSWSSVCTYLPRTCAFLPTMLLSLIY